MSSWGSGTKRCASLLLAGVITAAILLAIYRSGTSLYQGRPTTAWALDAYSGERKTADAAVAAFKAMGPAGISELMHLVARRDPFWRRQLWAVAPKLPSRLRQVVSQHVKPLETPNTRGAAARLLGLMGPEARKAIPVLARALQSHERPVCLEAAWALGTLGKASTPYLVAALKDPDPEFRAAAVRGLGAMGPDGESAIPALVRTTEDQDANVRATAASTLINLGPPGLLALENVVAHGGSSAREAAAKALMRFPLSLREATPALLSMAQDPFPLTRRQALEALAATHWPEPRILSAFTNAMTDRSVAVRLEAIKSVSLAGYRAQSALPAVIARLQDESSEVRRSAAQALGKMGARAKAAIAELAKLQEDEDERVRAEAGRARAQLQQAVEDQSHGRND